jgi:hypothetical protein
MVSRNLIIFITLFIIVMVILHIVAYKYLVDQQNHILSNLDKVASLLLRNNVKLDNIPNDPIEN